MGLSIGTEGTKAALTKLQEAYAEDILVPQHITHGSGMMRAYTMKIINALFANHK